MIQMTIQNELVGKNETDVGIVKNILIYANCGFREVISNKVFVGNLSCYYIIIDTIHDSTGTLLTDNARSTRTHIGLTKLLLLIVFGRPIFDRLFYIRLLSHYATNKILVAPSLINDWVTQKQLHQASSPRYSTSPPNFYNFDVRIRPTMAMTKKK